MLFQTNASDLLVDLSTEKQEFLAGGCRYKYGGEQPTQATSPAETSPETPSPAESSPVIASQPTARLVVGNIITVTPFAKCLSGTCYGRQGS
ncbi:hypothetical protein LC593_18840 [Nostoc sp. CHAB 5844]|nr:hypothetical protein [Nostoc sp. CHAB 5844]